MWSTFGRKDPSGADIYAHEMMGLPEDCLAGTAAWVLNLHQGPLHGQLRKACPPFPFLTFILRPDRLAHFDICGLSDVQENE
jgi:hypothetical protein